MRKILLQMRVTDFKASSGKLVGTQPIQTIIRGLKAWSRQALDNSHEGFYGVISGLYRLLHAFTVTPFRWQALRTFMNQARAQGKWGMLKKRSLKLERRMAYPSEHRALLNAIKARDPMQAKLFATEHLEHVRRNLLGY